MRGGEKMEKLTIGQITMTWLNGGITHLDGGAMFGVVPKPLWMKKYPCNDQNQIPLRTDPILLQVDGKNILIESGIGKGKLNEKQKRNFGVTEESDLEKQLALLSLTTEDIDLVLMTHLHFDHASGLTKWEENKLVPTFPRARIITSAVEWAEMKEPNIRSRNTYWKENWEAIVEQVDTFAEQLEVVPGVTMIHTGGHSDGHSIIIITTERKTAVHLGDLIATTAQQKPLLVMDNDDYPLTYIFA